MSPIVSVESGIPSVSAETGTFRGSLVFGIKEKTMIVKREYNYSEIERKCEALFLREGPFWHLCTPGQFTELLFETIDDYRFIMNTIAIVAAVSPVKIITFEVMSNHLHFILKGSEEDCILFFESIKKRLKRYYSSQGRYVDLSRFTCSTPIPILDLRTLRIEICYVNRNGYVANNSYTPYSYPWGSGDLYWGKSLDPSSFIKYKDLPDLKKRMICKGRAASLPDDYIVSGDIISPACYCSVKTGMAMFRDAHHYFSLLTKNYEAYSEVAKRLGDAVVLPDEEMFAVLTLLSKQNYGGVRPTMLPVDDKISLAKILRSNYNASEGQIQRMLRLDRALIAELFGK